ncbi:protein prenylyltransferase [Jaminaea rosea]|uniref:Geranylgeranyl transferase type-2 subunit alpha n=1 Tax=Jaminaea rosea TaxID=1569628 RepID=A0A316UTD1_9BASI|nr:protein prenylyltransferase [Jaminaea rosea]PWN28547.1 protein prenylyltransferase [Jaminaea rosea]
MHGVKRSLAPPSASAREARKKKEAAKLDEYLVVEKAFFDAKQQGALDESALDATTNLLAANPEHYTAWNYRRSVLSNLFAVGLSETSKATQPVPDFFAAAREPQASSSSAESSSSPGLLKRRLLEEDLALTQEALRIHPKVYWIWNHRKWCLIEMPNEASSDEKNEGLEAQAKLRAAKWQREMGLVNKMLELDPRNFHGWDYRRYLLTQIALASVHAYASSPSSSQSLPSWPFTLTHPSTPTAIQTHHLQLARAELTYTLRKIEANFSNFSAWHQRSLVLPQVWGCETAETKSGDRWKKLDEEFDLVRQAMYTDPDDSSVWLYHAWLVDQLDHSEASSPEEQRDRQAKSLQREMDSISELLEVEPESKWCLEALIRYQGLMNELQIEGGGEGRDRREMLRRLIEVDPDRRGRWASLLEKEQDKTS